MSLLGGIIGSSIIGGLFGLKGADEQADASRASVNESRRQYNQTRSDFAPYREAGVGALGRLNSLSQGDNSSFFNSPGYEFRRDEGTRNIQNSFAGRGSGGNALKALAAYNSGLASQEYGNYWNPQAGLAGVGQTATQGTAYAGANAAGQAGNALLAGGNARASGLQAVGNSINAGIGNFMYGQGAGLFGNQQPQRNAWTGGGLQSSYDYLNRRGRG